MTSCRRFRDWRLRTKVLLTPVLLVLSLGAVSGLGTWGMWQQRRSLGGVYDVAYGRLPLIHSFLSAGEKLRSEVLDLYASQATDSPAIDRARARARVEGGVAELRVLYGEMLTTWTLTDEERDAL